MNEKSANILELPKILEHVAQHTTFSAGRELVFEITPTPHLEAALELQEETTEARRLLQNHTEITLGGVFDIRASVLSCQRAAVLDPSDLLDIRSTLRRTTTLRRIFSRIKFEFPRLADLIETLNECPEIQQEISRVVDDNGRVMDSASAKLAMVRRDLRIAFDRLQTKIHNIANNPNNAQFLQESIVTQRHGRYVIPLKAEFKGRIQGIIHDQSSSGATLFIEPLATVELNNTCKELELEEENEIRRILSALSDFIGQQAELIVSSVETLAYFDLVLARAKYAEQIRATQPKLVGFRNDKNALHPGGTIKLIQARHPLLKVNKVVPIDVDIDENTYLLVITGPNTGGKTVALKTVGLLALMTQCGFHLPVAEGSSISIFEDIYADIGDEQSIEQSLSTFSSHMTNIIEILKVANRHSLVILDELGAGTDPAEGSALARAILMHLLTKSITTIVTTHHPELKAFSYNHEGMRNASVEFDLETLAPTYRLIIGLPGRSNALAIATRLGLPLAIVENARSMVTTDDLAVDNLLEEIYKSREEARQAMYRAKAAEDDSEMVRSELNSRLSQIAEERHQILQEAREQVEQEIASLQQELRYLRRRLQAAGQPLEIIQEIETEIKGLESQPLLESGEIEMIEDDSSEEQTYRLGDTIWLASLHSEGQITEIASDEVEVRVGRLRVRAKLSEVERLSRSERRQKERERQKASRYQVDKARQITPDKVKERPPSPGLELDLRGSRVEEAMPKVENYLDAAYMAGLPFVRIIHGKGTGALRKAIREHLNAHPLVAKHGAGSGQEGGDGVTIVHFVSIN